MGILDDLVCWATVAMGFGVSIVGVQRMFLWFVEPLRRRDPSMTERT